MTSIALYDNYSTGCAKKHVLLVWLRIIGDGVYVPIGILQEYWRDFPLCKYIPPVDSLHCDPV